MASTLQPSGPFGQVANLSFFFVALFGDVLLIRFFCTLAYIFLLIGAATGYPRWQAFAVGPISVDGLVWSSICLLLHGYALISLLLDERRIKFRSTDEEQLWRFFYRRSGMGRLEMKEVLKYGRWMRVPAGQPILSEWESRERLCLLVEGQAVLYTRYHGVADMGWLQYSGYMFDLGLCNVFGVYLGFERGEHKSVYATAQTDCLLYSWSVAELNLFATGLSPALAAFWRNFVLCQLGMGFDWRAHEGAEAVSATGEAEPPEFAKGCRSRDFTDPLRRYERQPRTAAGFFAWLWRSLHPFLPRGIRHTALPVSGILARNRVIAVKAAEAWKALSRQPSARAAAADGEEEPKGQPLVKLQPAIARCDRGAAVHRLLRRLQSMRQLEGADMEVLALELLQSPGGVEVVVDHLTSAAAAGAGTGAGEPSPPRCPVEGCTVGQAGGAGVMKGAGGKLRADKWLFRQLSPRRGGT